MSDFLIQRSWVALAATREREEGITGGGEKWRGREGKRGGRERAGAGGVDKGFKREWEGLRKGGRKEGRKEGDIYGHGRDGDG